MASFQYKAKRRSGETVSGTVECEDIRAAERQLREEGLFVLTIRTQAAGKNPWWNPFYLFMRYVLNPIFAGASVLELAVFYRQLSAMIRSGITVMQAIQLLSEQGENARLRKVATETVPWLDKGGALSDAFARYPWMFSQLQISILKAGEISGDMEGSTDRIAHYLEWENSLRQKVKIASIYPKILVVCIIFIPKIYLLLTDGASKYFSETLGILLPVLGAIALLWMVYRLMNQFDGVRNALDMLKLAVPKIGGMIRMLALAKFYRAFSAMYSSGVPLVQGMQYAAESIGNNYLTKQLLGAIPKLDRGIAISDALNQTGALPRMAQDMLRTGKSTGNVDEMLNKLAEYTEGDAEVSVIQTTVILGTLLIIVIGIYIGYIVVQFHTMRAQSMGLG